ncbi:MAG: NAD(P)-dependent oxidoreductase [Nanoarchaeota archaeon]
MTGKTVLFGGSGFLGPIILEKYPEILSLGRSQIPKNLKNKHININIEDLSSLDNLDFDRVIFLIGNSNHHQINKGGTMGIDYNVLPLKKALDYLKKRIVKENKSIKKFIAFSGALVYDWDKIKLPVNETQPINPYKNDYLFSKYMAEELTKCYPEIPIINIRLCNIYGPTKLIRPDFVPTLIQNTLSPNQAEVWSTKPERDFIYAKDAAEAIVLLLEADYTGLINLGTGTMRSCGEVVKIIEKLSGKKAKDLDVPVSGQMKFVADNSLLRKLTGWVPKYSLEEGLTETYNTMKEYAEECKWWEKKEN